MRSFVKCFSQRALLKSVIPAHSRSLSKKLLVEIGGRSSLKAIIRARLLALEVRIFQPWTSEVFQRHQRGIFSPKTFLQKESRLIILLSKYQEEALFRQQDGLPWSLMLFLHTIRKTLYARTSAALWIFVPNICISFFNIGHISIEMELCSTMRTVQPD